MPLIVKFRKSMFFFSLAVASIILPQPSHAQILDHKIQAEKMQTNKTIEVSITEGERPTLVFFWSNTCENCKLLNDELIKLRLKYGQKFKVIGFAVDDKKSNAVAAYAAHYSWIKYQYWLKKPSLSDSANFPNILPHLELFDKFGKINTVYEGVQSDKVHYMKQGLANLLKENFDE